MQIATEAMAGLMPAPEGRLAAAGAAAGDLFAATLGALLPMPRLIPAPVPGAAEGRQDLAGAGAFLPQGEDGAVLGPPLPFAGQEASAGATPVFPERDVVEVAIATTSSLPTGALPLAAFRTPRGAPVRESGDSPDGLGTSDRNAPVLAPVPLNVPAPIMDEDGPIEEQAADAVADQAPSAKRPADPPPAVPAPFWPMPIAAEPPTSAPAPATARADLSAPRLRALVPIILVTPGTDQPEAQPVRPAAAIVSPPLPSKADPLAPTLAPNVPDHQGESATRAAATRPAARLPFGTMSATASVIGGASLAAADTAAASPVAGCDPRLPALPLPRAEAATAQPFAWVTTPARFDIAAAVMPRSPALAWGGVPPPSVSSSAVPAPDLTPPTPDAATSGQPPRTGPDSVAPLPPGSIVSPGEAGSAVNISSQGEAVPAVDPPAAGAPAVSPAPPRREDVLLDARPAHATKPAADVASPAPVLAAPLGATSASGASERAIRWTAAAPRRAGRDSSPVGTATSIGSALPTGTAAAMPVEAPLDLSAAQRDDQWMARLMTRIEATLEAVDAGSTRIRLSPDALGSIDVTIERDGDRVHVHLAAENATTRALLADAAPRLGDMAEARGLRLGQTAVGDQGGGERRPPTPAPLPEPARAPARARTMAEADHPTDQRLA